MRVLHICSYYIGNKLYMNLMEQLSLTGITQDIFIPVRSEKHIGQNSLPQKYENTNYYYKNILKKHDKLFFCNKIKKQSKEIEKLNITHDVDFIHAHTLCSDGGTAYKLNKIYGIDYLVNIRNTDLNIFYRYAIHLRGFFCEILLNARSIVFLSFAYKQKLLSLIPSYIALEIEKKCFVIPNGIEDHWHENAIRRTREDNSKLNLLFIGTINKNKNLNSVLYACKRLQKKGYTVTLNILGDGPLKKKYEKVTNKLGMKNDVVFHGYITNKKVISSIIDKSDIFIMPSYKETFGLVYAEVMSRGIPVIYTKDQGFDGFFGQGEVGFAVEPSNIDMIAKKTEEILENYNEISLSCFEKSKEFNWRNIKSEYIKIYKE